MDNVITQESKETISETQDFIIDCTQNFQKFTYELFEKYGILNDLRAYLRSHIINVLRSTQTGASFSCQRNFVQRLELSFQALNILIAEYLLRHEFGYSLSVFVSEIPLANMVFHFAKSLMERNKEDQLLDVRFTDNDVWSILNYLEIPCDSEYASRLIQMYKNDRQTSLLLCILKLQPICTKNNAQSDKVSSKDTLSSRDSSDNEDKAECSHILHKKQFRLEKCNHLKFCKTCQNHILMFKCKYKSKKKQLYKNVQSSVSQLNVRNLMKNVGVLEHTLTNELFHQLKTVYETEVEMIKTEEEKNIKRTMANHMLQLQKEKVELEQCYKAREAELERNVSEKKKFLWGLARSLRVQHERMSRAMLNVRKETERLTVKEESLKTQVTEAEQILQKRGEEMRTQITNELAILEAHLSSMKKERESISKERTELENSKVIEHKKIKNNIDDERKDINSHYDLVKNELNVLKKLLETSQISPKCMTDTGVVTDICDVNFNLNTGLNNTNHQTADRSRSDEFDDRLKNQVVNDFKKKNVNFTSSNLAEIYRDCSVTRSHSSASSEVGDARDPRDDVTAPRDSHTDIIQTLRDENSRLKECARHQQIHLETLSRAASLLPCECSAGPRAQPPSPCLVSAVPAPGTPHTHQPHIQLLRNINTSVSATPMSVGLHKGAGEELSIFRNDEARVLVPGDVIPFVGVLRTRDRRTNSRRQPQGHGRASRPRTFPLVGVSKRATSPLKERYGSSSPTVIVSNPKASCSLQPDDVRPSNSMREKTLQRPLNCDTQENRDKSPKSILREAKAKLRNIKDTSTSPNETSPDSILREAKLKLRKLEIEAEAMENSYRDYRRKQSELRAEKTFTLQDDTVHTQRTGNMETFKEINRPHSLKKFEDNNRNLVEVSLTDYQKAIRNDFDKYLRVYQTKINIRETHFKNQNVPEILNPISIVYDGQNSKIHNANYLETPLTEFRKYYQSNRPIIDEENVIAKNATSKRSDWGEIKNDDPQTKLITPKNRIPRENRHSIISELEIVKRNVNNIYNLNKNNVEEPNKMFNVNNVIGPDDKLKEVTNIDDQNLLRVEVESVNEIEDAENISIVIQNAVLNMGALSITQTNYGPDNIVSDQMTIIVSPKNNMPVELIDTSPHDGNNSPSPEHEAHLSRNDDLNAIFHADTNDEKSSTVMNLDLSKVLESSSNFDKDDDLGDNLSAEVDNYGSHVEIENSPISLIKTSEDENFWN